MMTKKDFLYLHLKDLPYFRAILRANEACFYEDLSLPRPILDVGSGDGHFASIAFDDPIDIGVDPSLVTMREAHARGCYRLLVQSDGASIPLEKESIGSAISNSVLEHIPHLEDVLRDVARVLKPGAPFVFTVPNPGYRSELSFPAFLRKIHLKRLATAYEDYFMWMSRTKNMLYEEGWAELLGKVGLHIETTFRYFPPESLHALEWGHYFGAPTLITRWTTGKWVLAQGHWNLKLTEKRMRKYYNGQPHNQGTYSYYFVRKR
ncbi:MAG: class I SAM-dependent methyltransferase [Anaerolineales bacterium]|nr:class I SAM-dependent methyltransferase [Anaerolineales bacterium]